MAQIEFNNDGFYELRSSVIRPELERIGRAIQTRANATLTERRGYEMDSHQGGKRPQGRWRVTVYTGSVHAIRSDRKHNTLMRSISG